MKILSFLIKPILDIFAWVLKLSRHNIYYLVAHPLREEIQAILPFVFAHDHIDRACFLAKKYAPNEGGIILDVGGGQATTAEVFSKNFPQHSIYVFEPIKSNFEVIENSPNRTPKWQVFNKACGSQIGTTHINIANRVTASSLLDLDATQVEGEYTNVLQTQRTETIQLTTLDSEVPIGKIVDVLKLDVQGFELEVLKGALKILPNIKIVVLEINNHQGFVKAPTYYEIDAFMRSNNFELHDMLPGHRDKGKLWDWDTIYVNRAFLNK
jgi:FkbM family methyltransferase